MVILKGSFRGDHEIRFVSEPVPKEPKRVTRGICRSGTDAEHLSGLSGDFFATLGLTARRKDPDEEAVTSHFKHV